VTIYTSNSRKMISSDISRRLLCRIFWCMLYWYQLFL